MSDVPNLTQSAEEANEPLVEQATKEKKFPVLEIFGPTIQGEGSVIGMQTYFIRFGGCDYRCKMCDSLHAVLPKEVKKNATWMTAAEIFNSLDKMAVTGRMVTFSGGNPCMWDLSELVAHLKSLGWKIAVETQGTIWQDWVASCDYVTISPKGPGMGEKFEHNKFEFFIGQLEELYASEYAVKIVIFDQQDIEFAKAIAGGLPPENFGYRLYLSVGNPYPPVPEAIRTQEYWSHPHPDVELPNQLLHRMRVLWEDISHEPLLQDAIFLPQLHVLLWGNKQGV